MLDPRAKPAANSLHLAALHDDVTLAAACLVHGLPFDDRAPSAANGEWSSAAAWAHKGRTALHVAAAVGAETVLELLLQNLAVSGEVLTSGTTKINSALSLAGRGGSRQLRRAAHHAERQHPRRPRPADADVDRRRGRPRRDRAGGASVASSLRTRSCCSRSTWETTS